MRNAGSPEVANLLQQAEQEARAEVARRGWGFLGEKRVAKVSPYDRARNSEPIRSRNPTFAVGRGNREAFFAAVQRVRAFRTAYQQAIGDWLAGTET